MRRKVMGKEVQTVALVLSAEFIRRVEFYSQVESLMLLF